MPKTNPKKPVKFPYPTEEELRTALLGRAAEFSRLTGMTKTEIGLMSVNDPAFLGSIEKDRNFGIKLYARFMAWLDDHWPGNSKPKRSARSPA